jgi:hypothetical protein
MFNSKLLNHQRVVYLLTVATVTSCPDLFGSVLSLNIPQTLGSCVLSFLHLFAKI